MANPRLMVVFSVWTLAYFSDATQYIHAQEHKEPTAKPAVKKGSKKEEVKWENLFDGKTLKNWKITKFGGEGEVEVKDGKIVMDYGSPITGITYSGKPPRIDYEIEVEAMPIEGIDFFVGLTMPVNDTHISLIVAGWAGAVVGLSNIDEKDASENDTTKFMKFETGKWYKVRARVEAEKLPAGSTTKKSLIKISKAKRSAFVLRSNCRLHWDCQHLRRRLLIEKYEFANCQRKNNR